MACVKAESLLSFPTASSMWLLQLFDKSANLDNLDFTSASATLFHPLLAKPPTNLLAFTYCKHWKET